MTRQNLLTNSSFNNGTTGWQSYNASAVDLSTDYHFYGSTSVRVTKYATNNAGIISVDAPLATPGLSYAASAYVFVAPTIPATQAAGLSVKVLWLDSLSKTIGESNGAMTTVTDSMGWVRLSGIFTAPAGTFRARFAVVQQFAGLAGQTFYVDAMLFEQSAYVGGYIDNFSFATQKKIVNKALTPLQQKATANLQLNADVVLDTLILNTIDEYGVVWVCSDIEGWWGQADPDLPKIDRGVDDGSYDVSGRYQARTLTLTGSFLPASPDDLPAARDRLIAATNLVRRGAWLRTNENPTKAAFVRLSGRPKIETTNVRGRTDFSIALTSGDPIKYHWQDIDPNGYTTARITANAGVGTVNNIGTSPVPTIFRMAGPMGAGTTIFNSATNETLTLTNPLRRASATALVIAKELYKNTAILTVSGYHDIIEGDRIVISGLGYPFDTAAGQSVEVVAESSDPPYTISYALTGANRTAESASGVVALAQDDVLEIDTYEKSVTFNGISVGQRSRVATLVDWISFAPGLNTIGLDDQINPQLVNYKTISNGDVTLQTEKPHYLITNEGIDVTLPTDSTLALKSLTNNYATLTTEADHGYTVGDKVIVSSITLSDIETKAIASNVATITTKVPGAFAVGDQIQVSLSSIANISYKAFTGSVISLTTPTAHGFSDQDQVTIALATNSNITAKSVANNLVTLTTDTNHNFSIGDTVTVSLPLSTTITNKYSDGTTGILTTNANHGFSNGDVVSVALPLTASLTGTATYSGGYDANYPSKTPYVVQVTTSAPHGFIPGDKIMVDVNNTSATDYTTYNGLRVVETVPSTTTFTYLSYGTNAVLQTSLTVGPAATVTNLTNKRFNGNFAVTTSSAAPNKFSYTLASA